MASPSLYPSASFDDAALDDAPPPHSPQPAPLLPMPPPPPPPPQMPPVGDSVSTLERGLSGLSALGGLVRSSILGSAAPVDASTTDAEPRTLVPYAINESTAEAGRFLVSADVSRSGKPRTGPVPRLVFGPFDSWQAASAAAEATVPPAWHEGAACMRCQSGFGVLRRRHHCRNCGCTACAQCCVSWPRASLPDPFLGATPSERAAEGAAVRVCVACDAATSAFRAALLAGDLAAAQRAYAGGRASLNLRRPFPQADGALLPVHCAAAGGALAALLVESAVCPV